MLFRSVGQDIDNAEFSGNAEDGTYSGYTAFRTTSQGTWVDLDFWHNYYTASNNGFGGKIYTPQTNSNIKDYFVNNALRAVQKSYQDIETHPDYGITLAVGFSKSNPKVVLVCQTYVTPCLMKSWSVSFGDFHPRGRIGKQL